MKVLKEQIGDVLTVHLSGVLDETSDFGQMIGELAPKMRVHCKGVSRVNSAGVSGWVKYFKRAFNRGTQLTLVECSPSIVDQLNMISNFACGGAVESVYLPFFCHGCEKETRTLYSMEELCKRVQPIPSVPCPHCGGTAEFDDDPQEYFQFVHRKSDSVL